MRTRCSFSTALLAFLCMTSAADAQPSVVQLSQLIGDDFNDVRVMGDYAYLAGARGLTVVSVADPANPSRAAFTSLPNRAFDVEIVGSMVYVATGGTGGGIELFWPFPAEPQHFTSISGSPPCSQMQLYGDYLYVAGGAMLAVYDVSSALSPQLVGSLSMQPQDSLFDLVVVDTTVYMVVSYPYEDYWQTKMLRADVSNPAQPVLDPFFEWTDSPGRGPYYDGTFLYMPNGSWTNLFTLPDMIPAGQIPVAGIGYYSDPAGMIVDHYGGVSLLQGSTEAASLDLLGWGYEGDLVGDRLYRAGARYGLQIVDVADPTDMQLTGIYAEPQHLETVIAGDGVAYAIGRELYTVDIHDLTKPRVVDRDPVYLDGAILGPRGYLIALTSGNHLRTYSTVDPQHPQLLSEEEDVWASAMIERNDLLYVADAAIGLRILDASNPAVGLPEIGRGAQPQAEAIALEGDLAYVCDRVDCVIYDVADPASPQVVGQFAHGMRVNEVLIAYDHLFVRGEFYGIHVYSLADPLAPALVLDEFPGAPNRPRGFDLEGIHLALVDYSTIRLYDIRNPAAPVEVLSHPTPYALPDDVDLRGTELHLATGSGYFAFRIESAVGVPPVANSSLVLGSHPNPATGVAQLYFQSPRSGPVELTLYDAAGRRVRTWTARAEAHTRTHFAWDGTDGRGHDVGRGTYFLRARAGESEVRHRIVWMR